jgi:hypothetical protein
MIDRFARLVTALRHEWRRDINHIAHPPTDGLVTSVKRDGTLGVQIAGNKASVTIPALNHYSGAALGDVVMIHFVNGRPVVFGRYSNSQHGGH